MSDVINPANPGDLTESFRSTTSETHLWLAPVADFRSAAARADVLSPDETRTAGRFHFDRDRDRYIASHLALRTLLSAYTGAPPEKLAFGKGPHGKPFLTGPGEGRIEFNLSHSGLYALIGISYNPIGVDVEEIRPETECMSIATRYFSPEELAWLAPMPREEQVFGFYRLWAVKEAFLKAVGTGLATPLTEVSVRFGPAPRARVLRNDGVEYSPTYSEELNLADGYSAAVVVNAIHSDVRLHRLNSHRR